MHRLTPTYKQHRSVNCSRLGVSAEQIHAQSICLSAAHVSDVHACTSTANCTVPYDVHLLIQMVKEASPKSRYDIHVFVRVVALRTFYFMSRLHRDVAALRKLTTKLTPYYFQRITHVTTKYCKVKQWVLCWGESSTKRFFVDPIRHTTSLTECSFEYSTVSNWSSAFAT